jgi:hypothetical protein
LVLAHGLGVGSRMIVGGDESDLIADFFGRLGCLAETAGAAPLKEGRYHAAVWLELEPPPAADRSLLSPAALGRTAGLLATLRPHGLFVLVARINGPSAGHEAACLEQHVTRFPGQVRLTFLADRTLSWLFGGTPGGYAIASWQAPAEAVKPALWRRKVAGTVPAACCRWAETPAQPRRAA